MINPWTPMSDQNRISPNNVNTGNWCEYGKISIRGLLVDPIPNSLKQHHKKFMVESKEDYQWDLWSERITDCVSLFILCLTLT